MPTARRGLLIGVACCVGIAAGGMALRGQATVGSVSLKDATVTGSLKVSGGRAEMLGGTTVTAGEHTAEMLLERGGTVEVCATSALHVTSGNSGKGDVGQPPIAAPLLLALDRGAVEVRMQAGTKDAIMTPDLRFGLGRAGPLDLRIRVTSNGDTCVENRGPGAPALEIRDQFGESSYELRPGQHVLFEHGSLKEVVDHESSPCGCPAAPIVSVADAGTMSTAAAVPGAKVSAAAVQHPFPSAESQGLAPASTSAASAVPQAPQGVVHAQVAATLDYEASAAGSSASAPPASSGDRGVGSSGAATSAAPAPTAASATAAQSESAARTTAPVQASTAQAPTPEAPPTAGDVAHRIGRFFKRIFGRG